MFCTSMLAPSRDRNGFFYGFIQKSPDDVFFHEKDNDKLDFDEIYGKTVLYGIFSDPLNGDDRAEIIEVLGGKWLINAPIGLIYDN